MNVDQKTRSVSWTTIQRLVKYVTGYWELKVVLILIGVTTLLSILSPAIIGAIIDMIKNVALGAEIKMGEGIERITFQILSPFSDWLTGFRGLRNEYAVLLVFSFSLIVISSLDGLTNYLQRYTSTILSEKGGFDIRNDLYNSLLEQSFSFYDQQRTGQLMARATGDINMLGRFFNFGFRMALSSFLLLLMAIYSMISLNTRLTLVSITVLPFLTLSTMKYSRRISPMWREVREQNGEITNRIQENLSGLRVVRGFSNEDYETEKFITELEKYFNINITMAQVRAFFWPLANLISSIGLVLIIWYGGNQVITGNLSIGSLVAFYFYLNLLMRPVRMLGFMTGMFIRAGAAAERVFEIIDAEIEVNEGEDAEKLENVRGRVTFENVWFSYDGENMVLKDIDLDVSPGETIAILGATGSGKSSIINLIPRFYDVSRGSIKIDGVDVREYTIKSLRSEIGIVRQDPFIFSKTLRENISYGVEEANLSEIIKAARQAKIHSFIEALPEGYETRVGERGVTLSGGQKQRVAIARALLKNPRILILDDSTSSVDTQTEYEIQQALDELLENRTTFIITQRLSSIKKADYIIVLEDGEIIEKGKHDELMDRQGIYYRLFQTQLGGGER
jgi:ATP-binding cassette subfamily B protein